MYLVHSNWEKKKSHQDPSLYLATFKLAAVTNLPAGPAALQRRRDHLAADRRQALPLHTATFGLPDTFLAIHFASGF